MSKEPEEMENQDNQLSEDTQMAKPVVEEATENENPVSEDSVTDKISESEDEPTESDSSEDATEQENLPEQSANSSASKIEAIKAALQNQRDEESAVNDGSEKSASQAEAEKHSDIPPEEKSRKKKKKNGSTKGSKKKTAKKNRLLSALFPQKGDSAFECVRKFVFLSSSVVFVICLGLIANYFWENHQNALLKDEMKDIYQNAEYVDETEPSEQENDDKVEEYLGLLGSARELLEINPDVVGWLSIPGTKIDYPVMQRKDSKTGNEYYLHHNIKGETASAGSIFLDWRANFDYVVDHHRIIKNSDNLIIYGHNMRDLSMFGRLRDYVNNDTFYLEHPIVELNSNYKKYKYKIFGMVIVDIADETDTKFEYWNKLDFEDEKDFYNYVNEVKARTQRVTKVDVKYGDPILTLSTCNGTFSQGRLVVFARALREGEDLFADTETCDRNPNIKWQTSYYRRNGGSFDEKAFVPYG